MGRAWFLIDETAGLAIASGGSARSTLLVAGAFSYLAWVVGTVLGVMGADLGNLESLAEVVFPVLFVALAALTARRRPDVVRALVAGAASLLLLAVWPVRAFSGAWRSPPRSAVPEITVNIWLLLVAAGRSPTPRGWLRRTCRPRRGAWGIIEHLPPRS